MIFSVLNEQKNEVSEKVTVTLPEKEEEMKKFLNENLDQIILGLELEYKKIFTDNFFKEEQRFFITKLLYNNQYSFELSKLIADIFLDKDDEIYEKLTNLLKTDKISKPLLEASFNGLEQKTELIIAFLDDFTNSKYWKYLVICNWAGKIILEKVKQIYFENDLPLMDFHDETAIIHKKIISFVNWAYEIENNEKEDLARKLEEYYYYADNENEEEKSKKELIDLFIDPFPWLS